MQLLQKIAVPTCEGKLWPHFGKAPQVSIFTVQNGRVIDSAVLQAPEHEHGAMPRFLDGSIIYGDGSCHHDGCGGHHHEH
jgi:hypothetical protein